ncbi:aldo/keto reductase, partial [Francisella tularensis]|uniref:aldo/keto reductase n=1 Tax=Francisella tularensis TaxID=263 RepID=UPI002381CFC0
SKNSSLSPDQINDQTLFKIRHLNAIAERRGQTLAQMAIAWTLRDPRVTSSLIGASSVAQLEDSLGALKELHFSDEDLQEIDQYATEADIN